MQLTIGGSAVFAATGGRAHQSSQPSAFLVHGAGLDHTVWALQSRWLAFHGWNVFALDLPGHGRSEGAPLAGIGELATWLAAVIDAVAARPAALIGHSMGSLVALETAAHFPEHVQSIALLGTAAAMPVHPELLAAAAADEHAAIDMVNLWGHGYAAGLGGSRAAGLWMVAGGERLLEKARRGVLHTDLAACNAYRDGIAAASKVTVPALLLCGERDQMTPLARARALAGHIRGSTLVALRGAGHMLMAERPYEVQAALASHLAVNASRASASRSR